MAHKTLGLVLAAGEGSRISHLLEEDEPVKAMLKLGEYRLIDFALRSLEGLGIEKAVLSFPSPLYDSLDKRVRHYGVNVLKQRAGHIKHGKLPVALELPYILLMQYYFSSDAGYLQCFDSVLTIPVDVVMEGIDLEEMLSFHLNHLRFPGQRQITILSKLGIGGGRAELFRMDSHRIVGIKSYNSSPVAGYELSTQAGIYIFSKGVLKHPFITLLSGLKHTAVLRYVTEGDWTDYGNPENAIKLKNKFHIKVE